MKQQFLPTIGEPPLKWPVWFQMFTHHLIVSGLDNVAGPRKLAFLRSSLGTEGYLICSELCSAGTSFTE